MAIICSIIGISRMEYSNMPTKNDTIHDIMITIFILLLGKYMRCFREVRVQTSLSAVKIYIVKKRLNIEVKLQIVNTFNNTLRCHECAV